MEGLLALVIGTLFASGTYLILRRSITKLLLGLMLLSHGANLLLFTLSGLRRGVPPLLETSESAVGVADPVPQALILTAIVIGFGFFAFALALIYGAYSKIKSGDINDYNQTDSV